MQCMRRVMSDKQYYSAPPQSSSPLTATPDSMSINKYLSQFCLFLWLCAWILIDPNCILMKYETMVCEWRWWWWIYDTYCAVSTSSAKTIACRVPVLPYSTSPCHPYNSLVGHECRSLDVFKNKSDLVILKSSSASRFNFCSPLLRTHPSYWFDQWLLDWASNKEGMGAQLRLWICALAADALNSTAFYWNEE